MKSITCSAIRRTLTLALVIAGIGQALAAYANTIYVGTCMPGKPSTSTIQAAVSSVSSGGTVIVCPGTYSGQVIIQQPLTLKALQVGENASAILDAAGSYTTIDSSSFGQVAGQIEVLNTGGTVDISGIVVDGTSLTLQHGSIASILVDSNSGTLNHVVSQNLPAVGGNSIGILVLDDNSVLPTVAVKNSLVNENNPLAESPTGIYAQGDVSLTVANSYILGIPSGIGITDLSSGIATISGNTIDGAFWGINVDGGSLTITGNTISDGYLGIRDITSAMAEISGNYLTNNYIGIQSSDPNTTIKSNHIFTNPGETAGIDLQCTIPATLNTNTVVDAPIGLLNVPAGQSYATTAGDFYGVPTIEQFCP